MDKRNKTVKMHRVRAEMKMEFTPLPPDREPAWRASLLSLLLILMGISPDESHQEDTDRRNDSQ
jgi:hypothetical protein